ncbi:hypothetical protein AB0D14_23130 [Streptomyces sp. NPDC048484]
MRSSARRGRRRAEERTDRPEQFVIDLLEYETTDGAPVGEYQGVTDFI